MITRYYPDFERPIKGKNALVCRYGAYGDNIVASTVLPYLKREGYRITYNVTERGVEVLLNNPYIDELWMQKTDEIPNTKLDVHWKDIQTGFDKFVQLNQSIEVECVAVQFRDNIKQAERRKKYNINFYENNIRKAGYEPVHPIKGELYFSSLEIKMMKEFLRKYSHKFLVVWCLAGSGVNKTYPWAETVMLNFLKKHEDAYIITLGDILCQILEPQHQRIINRSDRWNIRQACLAVYYSDLTVSVDTGILHAAGCFDHVPKIALLSVNTEENITKHFKNCVSMAAHDCECYPCHMLIYDRFAPNGCPTTKYGASMCLDMINPESVLQEMETIYERWTDNKRKGWRIFETGCGTVGSYYPNPKAGLTEIQAC